MFEFDGSLAMGILISVVIVGMIIIHGIKLIGIEKGISLIGYTNYVFGGVFGLISLWWLAGMVGIVGIKN